MNIIDEHYVRKIPFSMRTSAMDPPDTISACVPPAPNPLRDSPKPNGNFKKRILSSVQAAQAQKPRVIMERLEDALRHTAHLVPRSNGSYTVFPCGQGKTARDQGQTTRDHGQTTRDQGQTTSDQGQTTRHQGQITRDQGLTTRDQGQPARGPDQTTLDEGQTTRDRGQTTRDHGQTKRNQGQSALGKAKQPGPLGKPEKKRVVLGPQSKRRRTVDFNAVTKCGRSAKLRRNSSGNDVTEKSSTEDDDESCELPHRRPSYEAKSLEVREPGIDDGPLIRAPAGECAEVPAYNDTSSSDHSEVISLARNSDAELSDEPTLGDDKDAQSPVGGVDNSCLPAMSINTSTPEPQPRSRVASPPPRVATHAEVAAPYLSNSVGLRKEVCESTPPSDVTTIHVPRHASISDATTYHEPQYENISDENISGDTMIHTHQHENINDDTTTHTPQYENISDENISGDTMIHTQQHENINDDTTIHAPQYEDISVEPTSYTPQYENIRDENISGEPLSHTAQFENISDETTTDETQYEEIIDVTTIDKAQYEDVNDVTTIHAPQYEDISDDESHVFHSGVPHSYVTLSPPGGSSVEESLTPAGPPGSSSIEERVTPAAAPEGSSVEETAPPASPKGASSVEERVTPSGVPEGSSVQKRATLAGSPEGSSVEERVPPASSLGCSSVEERVPPAISLGCSSVEERVPPASSLGCSSVEERVPPASSLRGSSIEERVIMPAGLPAGSLRGRRVSAPELRHHTATDRVVSMAGKRGVRSSSLSAPVTDGMPAEDGSGRGVTKLKLSRCKDRSWTVVQQVLSESEGDGDDVPTTPKIEPTVVEATESNSEGHNSACGGLMSLTEPTKETESNNDEDNRGRIPPTEPIVIQATVTAVLIDNGTEWSSEQSSISPATDDAYLFGTRRCLRVLSEADDAGDDPTEIYSASEVVSELPLDCSVPLLFSGDTRQVCLAGSDSEHRSKCSANSEHAEPELKPVLQDSERERLSDMVGIQVGRSKSSSIVNIESSVPLTQREIACTVELRSRTTLGHRELSAEAGVPRLCKVDSTPRTESRDQLTECVSEMARMATTCDRVSEGGQLTECASETAAMETACDRTSTLEATQGVVRKGRGRPPKSKNKVPPVDKPRTRSKKNSRKSFRHDSIQTFKPTPQVIPTPPWRYKARPHLTSPDVAAMMVNKKTPASSRDSETSTDEPSVEASLADGDSVESATDASSGPARRTSTEAGAPARRVSTEAGVSPRSVSVEARGPARRGSAETAEETGRGKSGSSEIMSDSSAKSSECSRSEDGEEVKRKKLKKETSCVMREVYSQFVAAQMQEKGRRLAQEIPRFNWLEEKIRNGGVGAPPKRKLSVPSKATPATEETKLVESLGLHQARSSIIPRGPTDTTTPPQGLSHAATGLRSFRMLSDGSVPPVAGGGAVPCGGGARHIGLQQLANDTGLTITLMPPVSVTPPQGRASGGLGEDRNSKQRLLRPRPSTNIEADGVNAVVTPPHPIAVWGFSDHVATMARHSATSFDTGLGVSEAFPGPVGISLGPVGASLGPLESRPPQGSLPSSCQLQASRSGKEDPRDGPLRPTPYYRRYGDSPVGRGEQHLIPRNSNTRSSSTSSTAQEKELQVMIAESDSLKSMATAYESQLRLRHGSEFQDRLRQEREYEERLRRKKESEEKLCQFNEEQARLKKCAELAMGVRQKIERESGMRQENGSAAQLHQKNEQEARLHQENEREAQLRQENEREAQLRHENERQARLRQENEREARLHQEIEREARLRQESEREARLRQENEQEVRLRLESQRELAARLCHENESTARSLQRERQDWLREEARLSLGEARVVAESRQKRSDVNGQFDYSQKSRMDEKQKDLQPVCARPAVPSATAAAISRPSHSDTRWPPTEPPARPTHNYRSVPHPHASPNAPLQHSPASAQSSPNSVRSQQQSPQQRLLPHTTVTQQLLSGAVVTHQLAPSAVIVPRQSPVDTSQRQLPRHRPQSPVDTSQRQLPRQSPVDIVKPQLPVDTSQRQLPRHHPQSPGDISRHQLPLNNSQHQLPRSVPSHQSHSIVAAVRPLPNEESTRTGKICLPVAAQHRQAQGGFRDLPPEQREVEARFLDDVQNRGMDHAVGTPAGHRSAWRLLPNSNLPPFTRYLPQDVRSSREKQDAQPVRIQPYPTANQQLQLRMLQERQLEQLQRQQQQAVLLSHDTNQLWLAQQSRRQQEQHHLDQQQLGYGDTQQRRNNALRAVDPRLQDSERDAAVKARQLHEDHSRSHQGFREPQTMAGASRQHSLDLEMYASRSQADDVRRNYGEGYMATHNEFSRGVLRNPELSVEPARTNRELLGGGSVQVAAESERYRLARMQVASTVNHRSNEQPNGEPNQFYRYARNQEETFRAMPVEMAAQHSQHEDWPIRPTPLAAQEAQRFVIHEQLRRDRAVQSAQLYQTRSVQSEQLHPTPSVQSEQLHRTQNHIIASSPKAKDPQGNVRPLMMEYSHQRIDREQSSIEEERDKVRLVGVRNLPENNRLRESISGTGMSNGRVQQSRPESIQKHVLLPSKTPSPIIGHPHKVIINITTANAEPFNNNGSSKNLRPGNIHGDASQKEKHTIMATISPSDPRSLTPIESPTTLTKNSTRLKSDSPNNIDKLTDDPDVEELAIDLSMPKRRATDVQHSTSKKHCSGAYLSPTNVLLAAEKVQEDTSNMLHKASSETLILEKPLSEELTNGGTNETGEEVNQDGRLMIDVEDDVKSEDPASDESLNTVDEGSTEGVATQGMPHKQESSLTPPTEKPRDLAPSSPLNVIRLGCTEPGPETRNYYNNRLHVTPVHDALRRQPGAVRRVSSEMQHDLATRQQLQANQSQVSVTKQTAQNPSIVSQCDIGVRSVGGQQSLPETRANVCRNDKPVMKATSQITQHPTSSENSVHAVLDNGSSVILSHVEHSAERLSQGQQSSLSRRQTETVSPSQHCAKVEQTVIKSPSHRPTIHRGSLPTQAGGQLTALHLSEPSLSSPSSSRANTSGKTSVSVPVIEHGRRVGQNLQLSSTEMPPTQDYEVRIQSLPQSGARSDVSNDVGPHPRQLRNQDPRQIIGSSSQFVEPGRRTETSLRALQPGSKVDKTVDPGRRMETSFRTVQPGSRIDQTVNPVHRILNTESGSRINQSEDPGRRMQSSFRTVQSGSRIDQQPVRHVQVDSELLRHVVHQDHGYRMVQLPRNVEEVARVELPPRSMKPPENNGHPGIRPRQPQMAYNSRMEPPPRNGHPGCRVELPLRNLEPSSRMERPQTTVEAITTRAQPQNPNEARYTMDRPQRPGDLRNPTEQTHWPLDPEGRFERPQNPMERWSRVDEPQTVRVHINTMGQCQNAGEPITTIEHFQNYVEPRTIVESRQWPVEPRITLERSRWPVGSRPPMERPGEHWVTIQPTQWSVEPTSTKDRPQNHVDRGSMVDRCNRPRDQATVMQRPPWTGGRSMARDISPLAAESPGLHCPDPPAVRLDACCNCSRKAEFMCSSCRVERYCSTQCQTERWLVHNTECGQLAQSNWVN